MGTTGLRRRHPAFAAGLATLALALGFTAAPAGAAPPRDVDYVALGDSYTAGTGAGDFVVTSTCVQTDGGYVDAVDKSRLINLTANAACHGALLDPLSNIPHDPRIPSVNQQIDFLIDAAVLTSDTELVSITAGANDVGVTGVLVTCLTQPQNCLGFVQDAVAAFPEMQTDLVAALQKIQAAAPDAETVVLGYPRLFDPALPFGNVDPVLLVAINAAVDLLNGAIEAAVEASGTDAVFVDVTERFVGHEVNSSDPWIFFTAPTVTPDGIVFDPRNFHPTPDGHRAYAAALLAAARPGVLARP